jgi:hypothetical protein
MIRHAVIRMTTDNMHSHHNKRDYRQRVFHTVLATIGYILSPLSWWNDMVVNVPLAYALSWPFARLNEHLFLYVFVVAYWLTNLAGLLLLHIGIRGVATSGTGKPIKTNRGVGYHMSVSLLYTAIIILCVWLEWIPSPGRLLQAIQAGLYGGAE